MGRGGMLVGVGAVGQRAFEQGGVTEAVVEGALQAGQRVGVEIQGRYRRKASVAFVPPNPKALDRATSTSCLRAWLGT